MIGRSVSGQWLIGFCGLQVGAVTGLQYQFRKRTRELREVKVHQRLFLVTMWGTVMIKNITLAVVLGLAFASSALAADCVVHYDRTACPGKEAESYSKCDGKKACDKEEAADSEAACTEAAMKACENSRLEITKSKVITATFKGKALKAPHDGSFCAADRPDFNKCK
jgi:uncharacterized membrane protein